MTEAATCENESNRNPAAFAIRQRVERGLLQNDSAGMAIYPLVWFAEIPPESANQFADDFR